MNFNINISNLSEEVRLNLLSEYNKQYTSKGTKRLDKEQRSIINKQANQIKLNNMDINKKKEMYIKISNKLSGRKYNRDSDYTKRVGAKIKQTYNNKSEEQKQQIKNKISKSQSIRLNNLTNEQKQQIYEKRRQTYSLKTKEELRAIINKSKKTRLENYNKLSEYEKKQINTIRTYKVKETWLNKTPEEIRDIAVKRGITSKSIISVDGKRFDSRYEKYVYEFCLRNNIKVERQVPIKFEHNGNIRTTLIDFKIDDILFECKGGHLLTGTYSDRLEVPIKEKLDIYKKNNVIIITDTLGSSIIPKSESELSDGLKYLDKCKEPLIGVDIELFNNPTFPFRKDRPECFYKVKVDNQPCQYDAFYDEKIRWKMILNRINYVGGFIDSNSIIRAMNVTRSSKQPSWFSKEYAKYILKKYITTNTVIDLFAGWGTRYLACESLHKNYYGYDINLELLDWHIKQGRQLKENCYIKYGDANNIKINNENCSVFICPPYKDTEIYTDNQDISKSQCDWLKVCIRNIPNAKEYVMVCKDVDDSFKKYIVEEKINKSHFNINKEYVLKLTNKQARKEV